MRALCSGEDRGDGYCSECGRPRLLDLFCGAGGAGAGYDAAGFCVTGVDVRRQPRYPFRFWQTDAMTVCLNGYAVVHASPPCQRYSKAVKRRHRADHPDLVGPVRDRLRSWGGVYVIENVPKALGPEAVRLCGSSFGLDVQRHRYFESSEFIFVPTCAHSAYARRFPPSHNRTTLLRVMSISGGHQRRAGQTWTEYVAACGAATGIDWMKGDELSESIPPAYTEWIGAQVIRAIAT